MTSDQSAPSIKNFLNIFRHSEAKIFGHNSLCQPPLFMIDGSAILLISVLHVFNLESPLDYHTRSYRIISGNAVNNDLDLTNVHICSSHFMKNASIWCKKEAKGFKKVAMHWIGLLLKTTSMSEIDDIFKCIVIITNETTNISKVQQCFEIVTQKMSFQNVQPHQDTPFSEFDETSADTMDFTQDDINMDLSQDEYIKKMPTSPFAVHFNQL